MGVLQYRLPGWNPQWSVDVINRRGKRNTTSEEVICRGCGKGTKGAAGDDDDLRGDKKNGTRLVNGR